MRRIYAFEAEELSPEVKSQLEKVEDVVEDKCDTPEACDKILDGIKDEKEKFDGALKEMAGAAKDCQDGKCDKSEMAAKISLKMAELKEVAQNIGVASEGDTVTEKELQDAKAYLEGAEEIVEAKKDELENGCSSEECDSDDDGEEDEEVEEATEAYLDDLDIATESIMIDMAMEGTNIDALKARKAHLADIRAAKKEMKAAAKAGNYKEAAAKAREAASAADALANDISSLPQSAGSAAIVGIALAVSALAAGMAASQAMNAGKAFSNARNAKKVGHLIGGKKQFAHDVAKGIGDNAKAGFKRGAIIGGAGVGAVGAGYGATAIVKVLKNKHVVDSDGNVDTEAAKKLQPNDMNALLSAIKVEAKKLSKKYSDLAAKYDKKASEGPASESFSGGYDDFIAACESLMFGVSGSRDDTPYLFG